MSQGSIVIIGAGVLGLSCAFKLSQQRHQVTIIARDLPGDAAIDYASPWAGAHFRPSPARTPADQLDQDLMRETYRELDTIAENYPDAGVQFIPAIKYFESADAASFLNKENEYIDSPAFQTLGSGEYPAGHDSIQLGVTYRSWVVNSPVYLEWLQRRAEHQGVRLIRARVSSFADALTVFRPDIPVSHSSGRVLALVDASGRGLHDSASFPSRGQFVVVSNHCQQTISHHWADGSSTVVIPRPLGGGTVIGGTKEPHNWSEDISDAATMNILERAAGICPSLIDQAVDTTDKVFGFDIRQVYVARRPMRHGGLRLEKSLQTLEFDGLNTPLIHCYGAGPSGYKISWGVARRVMGLVQASVGK